MLHGLTGVDPKSIFDTIFLDGNYLHLSLSQSSDNVGMNKTKDLVPGNPARAAPPY